MARTEQEVINELSKFMDNTNAMLKILIEKTNNLNIDINRLQSRIKKLERNSGNGKLIIP